jgi:hypothetical protein
MTNRIPLLFYMIMPIPVTITAEMGKLQKNTES